MKKEKRPPLGYIPSGTVCDIGRNLGTYKNVKKALDVMLNGKIISYDVGLANNQYFVYTQATGTFVSTSYMTSGEKHRFGKLAYYIGGIKEFFLPTIQRVEFLLNNKIVKINTPLLLILNSRSVAGFPVNRRGKINSGKFDIYIVKNSNNKISAAINVVKFFIRGFLGLNTLSVAYHLKETSFKVKGSDELIWCIDGEEGHHGEVTVKYLPNQFQIYAHPRVLKRFEENKK